MLCGPFHLSATTGSVHVKRELPFYELFTPDDIACQGKFAFPSYDKARATARNQRHKKVDVYRCKKCRQWHIGAPSPPHRRRR